MAHQTLIDHNVINFASIFDFTSVKVAYGCAL